MWYVNCNGKGNIKTSFDKAETIKRSFCTAQAP